MNIALTDDLRNGMSLDSALKKHNLTLKDVFKTEKKDYSMVISKKKGSVKKQPLSEHYGVSKMINGKHITYGTYSTKEEAELVRDELIKVEWDMDQLPMILKQLNIRRVRQTDRKINPDSYIYFNSSGNPYLAKSKTRNGKTKRFSCGTYRSVEDARAVRDELVKYDWDITKIDKICNKLGIKRSRR